MTDEELKAIEDYIPDETELRWRDETITELIDEIRRLRAELERSITIEEHVLQTGMAVIRVRAEEREACAKTVESLIPNVPLERLVSIEDAVLALRAAAENIRARGKEREG